MESQILKVLGGGPGMLEKSRGLLRVEAIPMKGERCYVKDRDKYKPVDTAKKEERRQD